MFVLPFPFALPFGAAGDDWKKRGDEDGISCRAAWGVACTDAGRDRRGAGEDIFGSKLLVNERTAKVNWQCFWLIDAT